MIRERDVSILCLIGAILIFAAVWQCAPRYRPEPPMSTPVLVIVTPPEVTVTPTLEPTPTPREAILIVGPTNTRTPMPTWTPTPEPTSTRIPQTPVQKGALDGRGQT